MPLTLRSRRNSSRSARPANPDSCIASSRAWSDVATGTSSPPASLRAARGRGAGGGGGAGAGGGGGGGARAAEAPREGAPLRLVSRGGRRPSLEDRPQPQLHPLAGRGRPRPVADGPEPPAAFVDDPVPAIRRPRIDADDLHADTLGMRSDNSCLTHRRLSRWASLRPNG